MVYGGVRLRLTGPVRARLFFEFAGGAFLKFGQILALRNDVLGDAYTDELLHLLSRVPETPYPAMAAVFQEELGVAPETYFAEFDPKPLASASIAQVYRAKLHTGERVAVKIQRPNIAAQFENDFVVARFGADVLGVFHIARAIDWQEVVGEFIVWTRRELDFRIEAKNGQTVAAFSSKRPQTHIPKYYPDHTTERVLTSEFIEGLLPVERVMALLGTERGYAERLRQEHIDVDVLAEYFVVDMLRQFFVDGFFHADPHPANIYFLSDNRLGYLDFGIIGEVGPDRLHMLRMLHAISERDMYAVAKSFFGFARFAFEEDIDVLERFEEATTKEKYKKALDLIEEIMTDNLVTALHEIFDPWYVVVDSAAKGSSAKLSEQSASHVFARLVRVARDYSIYFPREVALFFRTLSIIDMVALRLTPRFNVMAAFGAFFTEFPITAAETFIEQGTYEAKIEDTIEPLHAMSFEQMMELKAFDQERLVLARERLADLMAHYAERYDEVRVLLKG